MPIASASPGEPASRRRSCSTSTPGLARLQILKADLRTSSDVGKGDIAALTPLGQPSERQDVLVAIDHISPADTGSPRPILRLADVAGAFRWRHLPGARPSAIGLPAARLS